MKAFCEEEGAAPLSIADTYSSISSQAPMFQAPDAAKGAVRCCTWGSSHLHSSRAMLLSLFHSARAPRHLKQVLTLNFTLSFVNFQPSDRWRSDGCE